MCVARPVRSRARVFVVVGVLVGGGVGWGGGGRCAVRGSGRGVSASPP